MKMGQDLCNTGYPLSLQQQPHLNPIRSFLNPEHRVQIYSNQNLPIQTASIETYPPQLHNFFHFPRPLTPDILWTSPRATRGSAIHVFLV